MEVHHHMSGPDWELGSKKPHKKPKKKDVSGIYIKPSHRGKFTARAKEHGNSVQEQAASDLANPNVSPKVKQEANFARNAKTWDK